MTGAALSLSRLARDFPVLAESLRGAERGLAAWMARARVERPVPASPRIRTGASVAAARSIPLRLSDRTGKSRASLERESGAVTYGIR